MVCVCVPFSPCTSDPAPWECVWAMEDQFDWALWRKTRATAILASVWAGWAVQVKTSLPTHSKTQQLIQYKQYWFSWQTFCNLSHSPVQCYGETTYCWCVDQDGREIAGTRSYDAVKPACEYPFNMTVCVRVCVCAHMLNHNRFFFLSITSQAFPQLLRP